MGRVRPLGRVGGGGDGRLQNPARAGAVLRRDAVRHVAAVRRGQQPGHDDDLGRASAGFGGLDRRGGHGAACPREIRPSPHQLLVPLLPAARRVRGVRGHGVRRSAAAARGHGGGLACVLRHIRVGDVGDARGHGGPHALARAAGGRHHDHRGLFGVPAFRRWRGLGRFRRLPIPGPHRAVRRAGGGAHDHAQFAAVARDARRYRCRGIERP